MRSIKKSVASTIAGLTASALFASATCAAVTVTVNDEAPLTVQSSEGFSYLIAGDAGFLNVTTDGFLFCANVFPDVPPNSNEVVLVPQHGDWALPTAIDLLNFSYGGAKLQINRSATGSLDSTLVCHAVGAQGETTSGFTDGLFDNGLETKTLEQYPNLINWIPPQGWNWNAPDWAAVPTDPCSPSIAQPAQIDEDITCAAVSGAHPAAAGGTTRSPTMWTGTDGSNYFYVVRVDGRWGAQQQGGYSGSELPDGFNSQQPAGNGSVTLGLVDAYDRGVTGIGGGYLADSGQWCILTDLPSTLNGNMCTGAVLSEPLNGPLSFSIHLSIVPPQQPRASFYAAFIRPIAGPPPSLDEPAVAVSILAEPSIIDEGGDKFKGDDVVFGFLPTSQGFPWMRGE